MKKYTQKEKEAIAESAFKDAPNDAKLYVTDSGTVLSQQQYDALGKAEREQSNPTTFTNPNKGKADKSEAAGDPEADKKLAAAEKEIERLNGLKSVKEAKAAIETKDAEIAELKKQIEDLTPKQ